MSSDTTWMILGGGGVFGNHLAKFLLDHDRAYRVVAVGRNPRGAHPYTLGVGEGDARYSYHQIHVVFEPDRLLALIRATEPHYIVNFAALAYATSWVESWRYYMTNVVSLAKLCEELPRMGLPFNRFIQISTSELYGSVPTPANEEAQLRPSSPYAVSKMAADLHLKSLHTTLGFARFPMNIIRPSNCYGPGQQLYRLFPRLAWGCATGVPMPLEGGGHALKSFLHADDLAHAIYCVAERGSPCVTYNVGPPEPLSIVDVCRRFAEAADMTLEELVREAPARPGEDAVYWLDSGRVRAETGWTQQIDLETGIGQMLLWARRYAAELPHVDPFVLRA